MNRIGDFLFVLARSASAESGHADIAWQKAR
jgi:cob(I)alamin adenosyltransferase